GTPREPEGLAAVADRAAQAPAAVDQAAERLPDAQAARVHRFGLSDQGVKLSAEAYRRNGIAGGVFHSAPDDLEQVFDHVAEGPLLLVGAIEGHQVSLGVLCGQEEVLRFAGKHLVEAGQGAIATVAAQST